MEKNKKIIFPRSHRIPALSPPVENVKYNLFFECQVARGSFAANIQKLSRLSSCLPRETAE